MSKTTQVSSRCKVKLPLLSAIAAPVSRAGAASWGEAVDDFTLDVRGRLEESTQETYFAQLGVFITWVTAEKIALADFVSRDMRRFQIHLKDVRGNSDRTRRNSAFIARAFFNFCVREDYLDRSPLDGYQVPKAARAHVPTPSREELLLLLSNIERYYSPLINPKQRFLRDTRREFMAARNFAVVTLLADSLCRIGELLALDVTDYKPDALRLVIREAKADTSRDALISPSGALAVEHWLKVRRKVLSTVKEANQPPHLFIDEFAQRVTYSTFENWWGRYTGWVREAVAPDMPLYTIHSIRHYSITALAKIDLWAASQAAGHANIASTQPYLSVDSDHVRSVHTKAGPLTGVLRDVRAEARAERRKRII